MNTKVRMAPIIHFKHPGCEGEIAVAPGQSNRVVCPHCKQEVKVVADVLTVRGGPINRCACCGHEQFYVQKDFNRQLGLVIVAIGIGSSLYFFSRGEPMWAMTALGVTAIVDLLVYLMVGEVAVCYSCHSVYRGFERNPEHEPFDLKKLEKYGGRSPRW